MDSGIIIGIDSNKCNKSEIIPFYKTFRKLVQYQNPVLLNGKYDEIVIYGHSLGEQDYSYFQSIFNFIDIYSSSTCIRFVYSDNYLKSDIDKLNLKTEKAKILYNLLDKY